MAQQGRRNLRLMRRITTRNTIVPMPIAAVAGLISAEWCDSAG